MRENRTRDFVRCADPRALHPERERDSGSGGTWQM